MSVGDWTFLSPSTAARRKGKGGVRAGASDVVEAQVVAFRVGLTPQVDEVALGAACA